MKKQIVYIAGPILNAPNYKRVFAEAAEVLARHGYKVINPAEIDRVLVGADITEEDYKAADMMLLKMADIMYMLPGWEKSVGARAERDWMLSRRRPVKQFREVPG